MAKPSVLFVLTSHNQLGTTGKPTGWYLPEFAHPYHVLSPVANISVASPAGGEAPLDPASVEAFKADSVSADFLSTKSDLWKNTRPIFEFLGKASDFDAVVYVGGHGPMFDLSHAADSLQLVQEFADAGKVVAAVCHGPAALVNVKTKDGKYLIEGKELTGFSNAEEDQVGFSSAMPFMLETVIGERGAKYVKADKPWGEKVVVCGRLITGQNPASATGLGEAVKKALGV